MNKPSAILTGDWHLREDTPIARTDNFWEAQWKKVDFISELSHKYDDIPVIHSGDLFNHWKPSPYLISMAYEHLPKNFYTIYGNHDLPQHNLDLQHKCGIYTLVTTGRIKLLPGTHWLQEPNGPSLVFPAQDRRMLVWHVMTYHGKKLWPGMTDLSATILLRKYPDYDLIVTGHNHQSFSVEYNKRLLINPGAITRQTADQKDFKPVVYLYWISENRVRKIYLPIVEGVVTTQHIDKREERDARIDAFISKLDGQWERGLNFEQNLEAFLSTNKVKEETRKIIYKAIES